YRAAGELASQARANGVATSYSYDSAGRLSGLLHAAGATPIQSIQYLLDANGNRTSMADGDGTTSYSYDALNRLANVAYPALPGGPGATSTPFGYDAAG